MKRDAPPVPRCVHHVALPCFDVPATHDFYAGILALPLVHAADAESREWGGRFLHLGYAIGDGTLLSFFALAESSGRPDSSLPRDVRHLALDVESAAELDRWRERLAARGVEHWLEHHGGEPSLYCVDPNGHVLELTAAVMPRRVRDEEMQAVLARWGAPPPQRGG